MGNQNKIKTKNAFGLTFTVTTEKYAPTEDTWENLSKTLKLNRLTTVKREVTHAYENTTVTVHGFQVVKGQSSIVFLTDNKGKRWAVKFWNVKLHFWKGG